MRTLLVTLAVLGVGCRSNPLVGARPEVHVGATALGFGGVYLAAHAVRSLPLTNFGNAPDTVTVTVGGEASVFFLDEVTVAVPAGASAEVVVHFIPSAAVSSTAIAHLVWSDGAADVTLAGDGLAWPDCGTSPCQRFAFSPDTGHCEASPVTDGTACTEPGGCLTDSVCVGGQCLGHVLDCDDGNGCTTDFCAANQGCQHAPVTCEATDPCLAARCDPVHGCTTTPVADGTSCGESASSCQSAGVCEAGHCTHFTAPDGTACTLEGPSCRGTASCLNGACVTPSMTQWSPGQVLWRRPFGPAGQTWASLHAVDAAGNGYASAVVDGAPSTQLMSFDLCGHDRWTSTLSGFVYGAMLSGGWLFDEQAGLLERRDAATGQPQWQVDLAQLYGFCARGSTGCGAAFSSDLYAGPPVLSKQGQLYVTGALAGPPTTLQIVSLSTAGQVTWVANAGFIESLTGGANQVADGAGDLYAYVAGAPNCSQLAGCSTGQTLRAFDHAHGTQHFSVPSFAQTNLAVGPSFVLDLGGKPSTAFGPTGAPLFSITSPVVTAPNLNSAGVIDAQGAITFWPGTFFTSLPGLVRVDAHGAVLASVAIAGLPLSEPALDDAGRVYVAGLSFGPSPRFHLWCWDGVNSTLAFDADLGPASPNVDTQSGRSLFISHGVALVDLAQQLTAVAIGPFGEALGAPWPRGVGGTNENRHAP